MIYNSLYLRKWVRYQGMHLCHRKYGHTCREKKKTYSYIKSSNNFPFNRYQFSRAGTMKTWSFGTHILSKEISACIFRSLLGNIDLMIFQIVFFSRDKISSSTALWHVEKKRLCILNNKMMQSCLKLYISFEDCGKSLVFITGYSRFQLRHI